MKYIVGFVVVLAASGCGCKDFALSRVTPEEQTIGVGESLTLVYSTGGGCEAGNGVTDVSLHASPTVWHTRDTLVVTVDALTGRVIGRAVGDAQVVSGGGSSATIHVR